MPEAASPQQSVMDSTGLFATAPSDAHDRFREHGIVVLRGICTPRVLGLLQPHVEATQAVLERTGAEFREHRIDATQDGLGDAVRTLTAAVMGVEPQDLTLADLLLSSYGDTVGASPSLHKDRLASEIAVGIPLVLSPGSEFVHVTDGDPEPNPFESAGRYNRLLDTSELIGLRVAPLTAVDVGRGDALMFPGSRWFHGRRNAAGTVVLYAKLNTLGLDPQGLDPRTRAARWRSLQLATNADAASLLTAEVTTAPQLVGLSSFRAPTGAELCIAELIERSVRLDAVEAELLRSIDGWTPVARLQSRVPSTSRLEALLRRLLRAGVLDGRSGRGPT